MTHDSSDQADQANMSTGTPPDEGSAGDVSTTGHSTHDVQDAHDDGGGHGGHGPDTSDVPTIVPTTWRQLILPVAILAVVAILVSGPIFNAFASRPAAGQPNSMNGMNGGGQTNNGSLSSDTGPVQGSTPPGGPAEQAPASLTPASPGNMTAAPAATLPSGATAAPQSTSTTTSLNAGSPISSATTVTFPALAVPLMASTQTAVAVAGEQGVVARAPVELDFQNTTFVIKAGDNLLPDWEPEAGEGIATWIDGTYANHILYVPFSSRNDGLFKAAKQGDKIKLTMNTGQVFEFAVSRAARAANGPASQQGQLTVNSAMSQDHAGVTLFLIGDPAADRAVILADFTGNIQ